MAYCILGFKTSIICTLYFIYINNVWSPGILRWSVLKYKHRFLSGCCVSFAAGAGYSVISLPAPHPQSHPQFLRTWDNVLAPSKKESLYLEVKLDWLFCFPAIWPKQIKSANLFELLLTDLYIECNNYNNSAGLCWVLKEILLYM